MTLTSAKYQLRPIAARYERNNPGLMLRIDIDYVGDRLALIGRYSDADGERWTGVWTLLTRSEIDKRDWFKAHFTMEQMVRMLIGHEIVVQQNPLVEEYNEAMAGQDIMDELNSRP